MAAGDGRPTRRYEVDPYDPDEPTQLSSTEQPMTAYQQVALDAVRAVNALMNLRKELEAELGAINETIDTIRGTEQY